MTLLNIYFRTFLACVSVGIFLAPSARSFFYLTRHYVFTTLFVYFCPSFSRLSPLFFVAFSLRFFFFCVDKAAKANNAINLVALRKMEQQGRRLVGWAAPSERESGIHFSWRHSIKNGQMSQSPSRNVEART